MCATGEDEARGTHAGVQPYPAALSLPSYELPQEKLACYTSHTRCHYGGVGPHSGGADSSDLVCWGIRDEGKPGFSLSNSSRSSNLARVVSHNFFGRIAYHLFESIYGTLFSSYASIETSDLVRTGAFIS